MVCFLLNSIFLLQVREFLLGLPHYGVLADVGCGNGKYFGVRPDLSVLGSDRSTGLALQAMKLCKKPFRQKPASPPTQKPNLCSSLDKESVASQGEAETLPGNGGVVGEQGSGSCMMGRSQVQPCLHADVLVADAIQLPYKVRQLPRKSQLQCPKFRRL